MGVIALAFVGVVGINISAALVLAHIDEVHLDDAIYRPIEELLLDVVVGVYYFLHVLNLEGIARSDAYHVLRCAIVAFLKGRAIGLSTIEVVVDILLFHVLVGGEALVVAFLARVVVPIVGELHVGG